MLMKTHRASHPRLVILNFELFPELFQGNLLKRLDILHLFGKKANFNNKFA